MLGHLYKGTFDHKSSNVGIGDHIVSTAIASQSAPHEDPVALFIAVVCVMVGTFMQALDATIANVALPYMQGSLEASRDQITWVLTSYIVASAIMTAPVGWLATRFGRRNFLIVCLSGFTLTSAMCGAALNLDQMILFRLLQGVFGAALSPLSQSIIMDKYPIQRRGSIMAVWGIVVMMGPIIGPLSAVTSQTRTIGAGYSTLMCRSAFCRSSGCCFFSRKSIVSRRIPSTLRASAFSPSRSVRCNSCWIAALRRTGSVQRR